MKRIPLQVSHFDNNLRIIARFLLRCENPKIFAIIEAIVDTGSPITIIGPRDVMRMRFSKVQRERLEGRNKPVNIGGTQMFTKILNNAKLKFGDIEIEMPIDVPIKGEEKAIQPSLLGVDFMLKTKAKLFFDPTNKEAYFEIEGYLLQNFLQVFVLKFSYRNFLQALFFLSLKFLPCKTFYRFYIHLT